jgi:prophage maintenance system killer protein
MLESAVDSPMNHKRLGGQDNVYQLAGILAEKLILNHSFQDGNKRLAAISVDMFLKMNGLKLQETPLKGANDAKIANAHVRVATKDWDAAERGRFYQMIATPLGTPDKSLATLVAEFIKEAEAH